MHITPVRDLILADICIIMVKHATVLGTMRGTVCTKSRDRHVKPSWIEVTADPGRLRVDSQSQCLVKNREVVQNRVHIRITVDGTFRRV